MTSTHQKRTTMTMLLYQIPVSGMFLVLSMTLGMGISFLLGSAARTYLIPTTQQLPVPPVMPAKQRLPPNFMRSLPPPVLGTSSELPASTRYTSKRFKTEGTASESFLVRDRPQKGRGGSKNNNDDTKQQRFSVDLMAGPDLQQRLSSESSVVQLLKEIMQSSSSTILSYHCDQVSPQHMTCVGIATQGHIIIHTSPAVVSIDANGIWLDNAAVKGILGGQSLVEAAPLREKRPSSKTKGSQALQKMRVAGALVHPAMLTCIQPETVVLVGGSEASLKQLLQHKTVKRLVLLEEVDPTWNSEEATEYPSIERRNETAVEWFAKADNATVDAIFIETPPGSAAVVADMERVLKPDESILTVKVSVKTEQGRSVKADWIEELSKPNRFEALKEYDQGEANFLIAFSDDEEVLGRWFSSEAEIQFAIRQRLLQPYDHIDAIDILSKTIPSKLAEEAFCDDNPDEDACTGGLDPETSLIPISSFEVKLSSIENAGRGIYAKHDLPEGAYVFTDTCVQNVVLKDTTARLVEDFVESAENLTVPLRNWNIILGYAHGYGFTAEDYGCRAHDVDPGIATFVNHGCNGTANVGDPQYHYLNEMSFSGYNVSEEDEPKLYNPAMDRKRRTIACSGSLAMRDIVQGEEVLNNYMTFETWDEMDVYAESLRAECSGRAVGQVSEYEMSAKQSHRLPQHEQAQPLQLHSNVTQSCRLCGVIQDIS